MEQAKTSGTDSDEASFLAALWRSKPLENFSAELKDGWPAMPEIKLEALRLALSSLPCPTSSPDMTQPLDGKAFRP